MDLPTTIYNGQPTPEQLEVAKGLGKFYKAIYFQGALSCFKLQELPKKKDCKC